MKPLLSAELRKQRTLPLVPASLLTLLALAAFITREIVRFGGRPGAPDIGSLEHAAQLVAVPAVAILPMVLLGALAMTGENRHRTLAATLLAEPRRRLVLAAKALVAGGMALVWALVATAVTAGVARVLLADRGVEHLADAPAQLQRTMIVLPIVLALFAVIGVALGALVGNQVVGVLVPTLWLLVVEPNAAPALLGDAARFLPGTAAQIAVGSPLAGTVSWWFGLVCLAVWAVALLVAASVALESRDI